MWHSQHRFNWQDDNQLVIGDNVKMPDGRGPAESYIVKVNLGSHHLDWVSPKTPTKNKQTGVSFCCPQPAHCTWLPSTQPLVRCSSFIQESGFRENESGRCKRKWWEKKGKECSFLHGRMNPPGSCMTTEIETCIVLCAACSCQS